jgi:hypothetical protein
MENQIFSDQLPAPPENQPPTIASPHYRTVYSNSVRLRGSIVDLQLTFSLIADQHLPDQKLGYVLEDQVSVVMPIGQAMQLLNQLQAAVQSIQSTVSAHAEAAKGQKP